MIRRLLLVLLVVTGFASAQTPARVVFTASNVLDSGGSAPLASGSVCFVTTDSRDIPMGYRVGAASGQTSADPNQAPCAPVVAGVIIPIQVINSAASSPLNACVRVVTFNSSKQEIRRSKCVQTGTSAALASWCSTDGTNVTCNWDQYPVGTTPVGQVQVGPQGAQGPPGCTVGTGGTCSQIDATDLLHLGLVKSTVTVAASNSSPASKRGANVVCTGVADENCINSAIAMCPASNVPSNVTACRVVLANGVYYTGGSVTIDNDGVSLEGLNHCMWGGYVHPWTGTSSPTGTIGTGCSQIRSSGNYPIVQVLHNNTGGNATAGDQVRHRGWKIRSLYLVGSNYTNVGIQAIGQIDDNVEISDNVIQRTLTGMNVSLDSPQIFGNSIQDIAGAAINMTGVFCRVYANLIFDNGGTGIQSSCADSMIISNIIGDVPQAITLYDDLTYGPAFGDHQKVISNSLGPVKASYIASSNSRSHVIASNTLDQAGAAPGNPYGYSNMTTTADWITVDGTTNGDVNIVGNHIDGPSGGNGGNTTFYAINTSLCPTCRVDGNVVGGIDSYWTNGKFNFGTPHYELDSAVYNRALYGNRVAAGSASVGHHVITFTLPFASTPSCYLTPNTPAALANPHWTSTELDFDIAGSSAVYVAYGCVDSNNTNGSVPANPNLP